jgi:phosphate transport system protein
MDELLGQIKQKLLRMSALAETMILDAVRILTDGRTEVTGRIEQHEAEVDRLQVEIDELCLDLIALHQPAAGDLRFILGAVKTNAELERLADQAINISHKAVRLTDGAPGVGTEIVRRMSALAVKMLNDSLHAYVNRDVVQARGVLTQDDELDRLKADITDRVLPDIASGKASARQALDILLMARNIERIGDHATNIAENTVFVAEGKDIRHGGGKA